MEINKKPPKAENIIKILFKNGIEKSYRVQGGVEYSINFFKRAILENREGVMTGVCVEDETLTIIKVSEIVTMGFYK